MIKDFDFIAK